MISRVQLRKWLARSVQGRRSFSFALLCVHQRAGAALMKKRERKRRSHLTWAAALHGRHKIQKTRVRASRFFSRRGLAAPCEREWACFRPGLAGALQRRRRRRGRLLSLPAPGRRRRRRERKKLTMLPPQQHAPRRDNSAPPRPPSRSHLRLS